MEIFWERPGQGGQSEPIARFLEEQGLRPDHGVQATVSLREDGRILACGGLEGNVIKTVAVDPSCQGQGLAEVLPGGTGSCLCLPSPATSLCFGA